MFTLISASQMYINAHYLLALVVGAVLLPLQRVSRSHYLADAEGIQLIENPKYDEGKHSLFACAGDWRKGGRP